MESAPRLRLECLGARTGSIVTLCGSGVCKGAGRPARRLDSEENGSDRFHNRLYLHAQANPLRLFVGASFGEASNGLP